jgi:hypothetical protein
MAMRLEFVSNIAGFERVEKALQAQQELLNANAEAVERLNNAQQGLSKTSLDTKSSESIRATASHIKDLTGSLETLNKTQSGMKGFLSSFSEFGKQIAQIKSESSGQIFKSMSDQMDTLKTNMRAAGFEMDNLRVKMNAAKASGNRDEEMALKSRMNQLGSETLANNAMKNQLGDYMFWNQPRVGNVSFADVRGMALPIMAGVAASSQIAKYGQSFLEKDVREENSLFARELGIGQAAAGGSIGRQALLSRGLGREAAYLSDPSVFDRMKLGLSWAGNFGTKSFNELYMEEAQRKAALDAKASYGMDRAGQFLMEMSGNQNFNSAERILGQRATQQFMLNAASSPDRLNRLTAEQSLNAMARAMRYGFGDQYSAALAGRTGRPTRSAVYDMKADILDANNVAPTEPAYDRYSTDTDNRRNYNRAHKKYEEDQARYHATKDRAEALRSAAGSSRNASFWSNASNLEKGADALMMDDASYEQFNRQIGLRIGRGMSYRDASAAAGIDTGLFRSAMGSSVYNNPDAIRMAQSYAAGLQSNVTTGPVGVGDVTRVMTNAIQGASAASADFRGRSGVDQVQIGAAVQQTFTEGFKPYSYQEQLYQGAMSRLGLPTGMLRVQLIDMIQKGQTEEAVKYMTDLLKVDNPKKDVNELENDVRKEFGFAQKNLIAAQEKMFGIGKRYIDVAKKHGLSTGASMAATGRNDAATEAAYGTTAGIFEKPTFLDPATGKMRPKDSSPLPAPLDTTKQELDSGKAITDKALLEGIKRIEMAIGSGAVKKEILTGLGQIADAITNSIETLNNNKMVTGERH